LILTVTPNAAVDKTYRVENFALDRVHRPSKAFTVAGGKGINVARVFQTLGGKAVATGFLGGMHGDIVRSALKGEEIQDAFVRVRGESRLCIAVVDPVTGTQTEINELGPVIATRNLNELRRKIENLLSQETFKCVILSGSLPPGVPETFFADLIREAHAMQVPCVLDTSGAALRAGVKAIPWMVKPNRVELEMILERPLHGEADMYRAAQELHEAGISLVALTSGAEGAYLNTALGCWKAIPPPIQFASAVASGDSFLAAFLYQWFYGSPTANPQAALRLATGAGAANAAVIGAGFCTKESIYTLAEKAELFAV
jgi:1-phosphofructokinase family hexose kinase